MSDDTEAPPSLARLLLADVPAAAWQRIRAGWSWLVYVPPLPCRRCQFLPNEFRPCPRHAEATRA